MKNKNNNTNINNNSEKYRCITTDLTFLRMYVALKEGNNLRADTTSA